MRASKLLLLVLLCATFGWVDGEPVSAAAQEEAPVAKPSLPAPATHPPVLRAVGVTPREPSRAVEAGEPSCVAIVPRGSNSFLFADTFESGDLAAWNGEASFSANQVLDLEIGVRFDGPFAGEHVLHLHLTTPKGHLYQTLTAPVTGSATASEAPEMRRVDGFPFPLPVLAASSPSGAEADVSFVLPVAGTQIITHSLYGEWQATAYLGEQQTPCGPSTSFFLRP